MGTLSQLVQGVQQAGDTSAPALAQATLKLNSHVPLLLGSLSALAQVTLALFPLFLSSPYPRRLQTQLVAAR